MTSTPKFFKLRPRVNLDEPDTKIYDAFVPTGSGCDHAIGEMEKQVNIGNFSFVSGWSDSPYRQVSVSDKELSILTFCEGDCTLEVAPDEATYKKAILEAHTHYVVNSFNGYSDIDAAEPIARDAIASVDDSWRMFRLQTKFSISSQEDVLASSWDLGALYRTAIAHLEATPHGYLVLTSAGGSGGASFGLKACENAFKEAAQGFNPLTRRMNWDT